MSLDQEEEKDMVKLSIGNYTEKRQSFALIGIMELGESIKDFDSIKDNVKEFGAQTLNKFKSFQESPLQGLRSVTSFTKTLIKLDMSRAAFVTFESGMEYLFLSKNF